MTIVFGCGAKWLGSKHAEDKYCDEIVQESDDELIDAADADALELEVFWVGNIMRTIIFPGIFLGVDVIKYKRWPDDPS